MTTRILLITDSAAIHTGLAENCRLVFKGLLDKYPGKYHLEQHGWFNFQGSEQIPWPIHNTNVINGPGGPRLDERDKYGGLSFEGVLAKTKPDIVWASGDIWCFDHILHAQSRNNFRLVVYYTIDGEPYFGTWLKPGHSSDWGQKLLKADKIVTWTEYGVKVLKEGCPELKNRDIRSIYHPADLNRFKSLNPQEKQQLRQTLYQQGVPQNAFILGFIGRNQFRKQNYKLWEVMGHAINGQYVECLACDRITVKEIDWCNQQVSSKPRYRYEEGYDYSYCWYCRSKDIKQGMPLHDLYFWQHIPIGDPGYNMGNAFHIHNIGNKVIKTSTSTPGKGYTPEQMARLMSSWDGCLNLSGGEGFNLPLFEAQQCSLPIIYANYGSHSDFAKHGGLPVRCDFIPEMMTTIYRSLADTGDAIKQILWAYRNREAFAQLGLAGRKHVEQYSIQTIVTQWDNLFTEMMQEPLAVHGTKQLFATCI